MVLNEPNYLSFLISPTLYSISSARRLTSYSVCPSLDISFLVCSAWQRACVGHRLVTFPEIVKINVWAYYVF